MDYLGIVNFIMVRLGNRQNLKARIESEMEYVKEFILEKDPTTGKVWFLLQPPQDLVTVAGQGWVDLPANFNFEVDGRALTLEDGVTPVLKEDHDWLVSRNRELSSSDEYDLPSGPAPKQYAIEGNRIYLFPTPDSVMTLKFKYYATTGKVAEELTANPWVTNAADLLLNTTGSRVAMSIQHMEQAQIFLATAGEARNRLIAVEIEREQTGMSGYPE